MMRLGGKWCLVTGAGSGIGRATALELAEKGAHLLLADLRQDTVDELAAELRADGLQARSYGIDVGDLTAMKEFAAWVQSEVGVPDVLINNAGVMRPGGYNESSFEDWHVVFQTNLWGLIYGCKLFVPGMVARGSGSVVNVASVSGCVGFDKLTAYSSSKFAVVGFSQALRAEVAASSVSVSTICPGLVQTNIAEHAPLGDEEKAQIASLLEEKGMSPEKVARAIVTAIKNGSPLVNVGTDAQVLSLLGRLSPAHASSWLSRFTK